MNIKSFWPRHTFVTFSLAALLVGVASFSGLWLTGFRVNLTPSLAQGVYRLSDETARKGDLVSFCLASSNPFSQTARERGYLGYGSCPSGLRPLLKTLAGLPGDRLDVRPDGLTLNGEPLTHTARLERDRAGRIAPPSLLRPGRIPAGFALVLSREHAGSFDSRYFGLIPLTSLKKAEPFLLF